ncbi:MAG: glycosyltransferase [Lachnospiraceae bacterium]|nr:glycosyltransferase [Lachnospiraceae bacterium]
MTYSVLLSVYRKDSPVFLAEALDSIYKDQTKKPDEIVIVEDGPVSDETDDVLKRFSEKIYNNGDSRIKIVDLGQNRGLGAALKEGTKHCTGDYIFRMDADDISVPQRFEVMSEYLESHPDIDVLGSDIGEFIDDPERVIRRRVCPSDKNGIIKMSRKRNPMNHVSVAIKRSSLIKVGGYVTMPLIEDYYLWVRMLANGMKLANLNKTLVKVRVGSDFEIRRSRTDRIRSWKKLQNYMLLHGMIGRPRAFWNMLCIRLFVYSPSTIKRFVYGKLLRKKNK